MNYIFKESKNKIIQNFYFDDINYFLFLLFEMQSIK